MNLALQGEFNKILSYTQTKRECSSLSHPRELTGVLVEVEMLNMTHMRELCFEAQ